MEYKIIDLRGFNPFQIAVNLSIKLGWEPIGGVSVIEVNNEIRYIQAMIKK